MKNWAPKACSYGCLRTRASSAKQKTRWVTRNIEHLRVRTTRRSQPSTCNDFFQTDPSRDAVTPGPSTRSSTVHVLPGESTSKFAVVRRAAGKRQKHRIRCGVGLTWTSTHSMHATFCIVAICSAALYRPPGCSSLRDSSYCDASLVQVRDKMKPSHHPLSFPSNTKSSHALNHR